MTPAAATILTIGHSTHPIVGFLDLLGRHAVTAIADVRSTPYSRYNPQFNRESLEQSLASGGIAYVYLGRELGARCEDPACYENGQVVFSRIAQTSLFQAGLDRVRKGAQTHRIALMCAEKEPLDCHRTLLVSQALVAQGMPVAHIHADGRAETHAEALQRLVGVVGFTSSDLFRSGDEVVAAAAREQESRIAYRAPSAGESQ